VAVLNLVAFLERACRQLGHLPDAHQDVSPGALGLAGHGILTVGLLAGMYLYGFFWLVTTGLYPFFHQRAFLAGPKKADVLAASVATLGAFYGLLQVTAHYGDAAIDWLIG
jgi:hypothetical protein